MFSIIIDQLRFKKLHIGEYDRISMMVAWVWMVLIGMVMNSDILLYDKIFFAFGISVILQTIGIYIAYLIMVWWLKRQAYYDGNGNLWGLVVTASTIDMATPLIALSHPIIMVIFAVVSFAVFYNALKSGLNLEAKATVITILVVTVFVLILGALAGMIAAIGGLPIEQI